MVVDYNIFLFYFNLYLNRTLGTMSNNIQRLT